MATYKRFEDLPIWQEARAFSKRIFEVSKVGDFAKEYRLCSQIHASSGSIMDNIAEGLKETEMVSLSSSCMLQKVHVEKQEVKFIAHTIMVFLMKILLKN